MIGAVQIPASVGYLTICFLLLQVHPHMPVGLVPKMLCVPLAAPDVSGKNEIALGHAPTCVRGTFEPRHIKKVQVQ
jgi:hypothetical protein